MSESPPSPTSDWATHERLKQLIPERMGKWKLFGTGPEPMRFDGFQPSVVLAEFRRGKLRVQVSVHQIAPSAGAGAISAHRAQQRRKQREALPGGRCHGERNSPGHRRTHRCLCESPRRRRRQRPVVPRARLRTQNHFVGHQSQVALTLGQVDSPKPLGWSQPFQ
jgi:hypothetical protein